MDSTQNKKIDQVKETILAGIEQATTDSNKELDSNSTSKYDREDPRVIAGLVKSERYFY